MQNNAFRQALLFLVFLFGLFSMLRGGYLFVGIFLIAFAIIALERFSWRRIAVHLLPFFSYIYLYVSGYFYFYGARYFFFLVPFVVYAFFMRRLPMDWLRLALRPFAVVYAAILLFASTAAWKLIQECAYISYAEKGITPFEINSCRFFGVYHPTASSKLIGIPTTLYVLCVIPVIIVFLFVVFAYLRQKHVKMHKSAL